MAPSEGSEGERTIALKRGQSQVGKADFPENGVKTQKYTPWNFLPKNIWEQLQKFGNCYFLVISVIMYLGEKTPLFVGTIRAFSTLGLLVMMMAVTAAMALYDDLQRQRADYEINTSEAKKVRKGEREADLHNLRVGDVLVVSKDTGHFGRLLWCFKAKCCRPPRVLANPPSKNFLYKPVVQALLSAVLVGAGPRF
ncbi:ALA2 [Symbiodinium sp. CCMP2592]|nr:ALA2 [Symbiodinium sp. CCMP2592]